MTVTDAEELSGILEQVRRQGYAVVDQEVELGLRSIAVPVVSARGVTVGALNVGLPARGDSIEHLVERYLPPLRKTQAELKSLLR